MLPCQPTFCQGELPTEADGFDVGDTAGEREQLSPSLTHDSHVEPEKPHVIKQASCFLQYSSHTCGTPCVCVRERERNKDDI